MSTWVGMCDTHMWPIPCGMLLVVDVDVQDGSMHLDTCKEQQKRVHIKLWVHKPAGWGKCCYQYLKKMFDLWLLRTSRDLLSLAHFSWTIQFVAKKLSHVLPMVMFESYHPMNPEPNFNLEISLLAGWQSYVGAKHSWPKLGCSHVPLACFSPLGMDQRLRYIAGKIIIIDCRYKPKPWFVWL